MYSIYAKSPLSRQRGLIAALAFALAGCASLGDPGAPRTGKPGEAAATVTAQPGVRGDLASYFIHPADEPVLSQEQLVALLRSKVRYVFVVFNENHSFDNEYGTFPGVDGLYSDGQRPRGPERTPGFTQAYTDLSGQTVVVTPFRIGPEDNSTVVDSVDHSHPGLARKLHVDRHTGVAAMDRFAADEYRRFAANPAATAAQQAKGRQTARLVMAHIDCDTIPLFWNWASRFTIFDHIFATEDTPSTPNAIAMLAGQAGETQWVKHPAADPGEPAATGPLASVTLKGKLNGVDYSGQQGVLHGPPLVEDPLPLWGSQFDPARTLDGAATQPASPNEFYGVVDPKHGPLFNVAANLTFATLPLTLMGREVGAITAQDRNPQTDLADVARDIPYIQGLDRAPVGWRWYQEGYDLESSDRQGLSSHDGYVAHHAAPQYFGYLANNPALAGNLRGMSDFFADLARQDLPQGGVFYVRGGFRNQMGLKPYTHPGTPDDEVRKIVASKSGDDDHPSYSDRQLSEAMAARVINAVAGNPALWAQSAIIITYDESDGFYDHVPPRILSYGPDKLPLARGIRVPLILISPYARTHAVSHVEGDHNAVIETINTIFQLPALASLPEEAQALKDGNSAYFNQFAPDGFEQKYLGPRDINSAITDSLLSGFSPARLQGRAPALPASFAQVPEAVVNGLPHYGGHGCKAIDIQPVTPVGQTRDFAPPAGFNPLPSTFPPPIEGAIQCCGCRCGKRELSPAASARPTVAPSRASAAT